MKAGNSHQLQPKLHCLQLNLIPYIDSVSSGNFTRKLTARKMGLSETLVPQDHQFPYNVRPPR